MDGCANSAISPEDDVVAVPSVSEFAAVATSQSPPLGLAAWSLRAPGGAEHADCALDVAQVESAPQRAAAVGEADPPIPELPGGEGRVRVPADAEPDNQRSQVRASDRQTWLRSRAANMRKRRRPACACVRSVGV